ncbi:uncharacterized protein LOC130537311 [Takifugu flavidus]|uniref:Myb-like domain-containing protein n=1 Tax=Takifugu bimaculatus TaxID=433685 RepID=A0A4Z2AZN5_9TELE|nr:uncharacterized protein LOC130537311 [Takifugu flavidus]TNM85095.1 hypothetical protein fugu_009273 [Takifugu bimaculatus]
MAESTEEKVHNWTTEETQALIAWRAASGNLFTGRRNSSINGWHQFVASSGLTITAKQAKKKWNNLKDKYKELRGSPTISGLQAGKVPAASWQWYSAMDAALRGQHSLSRPQLVVATMSAAADGVVDTSASDPSVEEGKEGRGKMPDSTDVLLGQLGIPKCISPQPATAATMVESTERKPHNWTTEETQALIEWREANGNLFTGRRNSSINGWDEFVATSGLPITAKQAKKKWNNLKNKYQELRGPPTIRGVEDNNVTAATWQWYSAMDAALRGQHSHSRPQLVVATMNTAADRMVDSRAFAPAVAEREGGRGRKRPMNSSESIFNFLKEQAEREEKWQRETLRREEERDRAESERNERFLTLFEKLVNKF